MYFPYLRGKQYEFIAVRELCQKGLLGNVIPIFEPVKENNLRYFDKLKDSKIIFGIITNPKVGNLVNDCQVIEKIAKNNKDNIYICILVTSNNETEVINLKKLYNDYKKIYIHKQYNNSFNTELSIFDDGKFNFISSSIGDRYSILKNKVLLEDSFIKAERNSDYPPEDYFSNYYLTYKSSGYLGISDYLTIGDFYSESGGQPYTVTIHLSFLKENGIYIKHFASDSGGYPGDASKKFFEALDKLVQFVYQKNIFSEGISEFIRWQKEHSFPGLGSVKKASMKHHIELLNKLV